MNPGVTKLRGGSKLSTLPLPLQNVSEMGASSFQIPLSPFLALQVPSFLPAEAGQAMPWVVCVLHCHSYPEFLKASVTTTTRIGQSMHREGSVQQKGTQAQSPSKRESHRTGLLSSTHFGQSLSSLARKMVHVRGSSRRAQKRTTERGSGWAGWREGRTQEEG